MQIKRDTHLTDLFEVVHGHILKYIYNIVPSRNENSPCKWGLNREK